MLFFVGPQHVPRPMGHLARGRHMRQEHETARLLALAGYDLSPLVEGDLQAIPQRFDHAWLRGTRPSRAILGMRLDPDLYPVIRARQRPQLGSGGLGIRMTEILLPGRFAHGRLCDFNHKVAQTAMIWLNASIAIIWLKTCKRVASSISMS